VRPSGGAGLTAGVCGFGFQASAGDEQARDALIEQSQRVSSRVLLAIERTASDECIAAVGATELDAGDLVDETLLEVCLPAYRPPPTT